MRGTGKTGRAKRGQSLTELAFGVVILVPFGMALFDFITLYLCTSVNDGIARDAARLAADKDPAQVTAIATRVVQGAYKSGGFIQQVVMTNAQVLAQDGSPTSAAAIAPNPITGGPYNGLVSVTTTMTITVPVPFPGVLPATKDLVSNQICPITYYAPAQQSGAY